MQANRPDVFEDVEGFFNPQYLCEISFLQTGNEQAPGKCLAPTMGDWDSRCHARPSPIDDFGQELLGTRLQKNAKTSESDQYFKLSPM